MKPDADRLVSNEEFGCQKTMLSGTHLGKSFWFSNPSMHSYGEVRTGPCFVVRNLLHDGKERLDYEAEGARNGTVEQHYKLSRINQTYDFVTRMRKEYKKLDKAEMGIWECCELLNEVIDDSDPDLDEPQIQHLLQSAEAIRKDYPNEDWLHLTALIHDLGKILILPKFGELTQWAAVGDAFSVGWLLMSPMFITSILRKTLTSTTQNSTLKMGSTLKDVDWTMCSCPGGMMIISLHKHGAYTQFMSEEDKENMKWLKVFNKYDLYSKSKVLVDVEEVKPYYESHIAKYFPEKLKW
ncbi:hypothetical protein DITRI_Ditri04bG0090200 [Diplodiscus trichospermus]